MMDPLHHVNRLLSQSAGKASRRLVAVRSHVVGAPWGTLHRILNVPEFTARITACSRKTHGD
eukprot:CAMPEP_0179313218 /NCGR_PEP_ID=MMETSP0797-20121207/53702_1 /TAXON_ID=47934 /ORGANISM="Dinophysis acuminata, Strain DAEP01" /LENGTH=61 /DNA_ID=CAMNT_0021023243 /DNA_START=196 /DNA_END=378 /DNA_ORIENTATION=+